VNTKEGEMTDRAGIMDEVIEAEAVLMRRIRELEARATQLEIEVAYLMRWMAESDPPQEESDDDSADDL